MRDLVIDPMIAIDPTKPIDIEKEMHLWTTKAFDAVEKGSFQGTVVGYWPVGSQIIKDNSSRNFCLTFAPPKNLEEEQGLTQGLAIQLIHNNVSAYVYVGGIYINRGKSNLETKAVLTAGVHNDKKICWITPFVRSKRVFEVGNTTLAMPKEMGFWGDMLEYRKSMRPGLTEQIQDVYGKLMDNGYSYQDLLDDKVRRTASETTKVEACMELMGKDYPFQGLSDLELFVMARTYLSSRSLLPESEMHLEGAEEIDPAE